MTTIQIRGKGNITLPVSLRNKYDLGEGDVLTLIDMGDGTFMLTPQLSNVNLLGEKITRLITADNISTDDLIKSLDEEREQYYREHYAKA